MTFEVLQRYQNVQKKKNSRFGCSIFVFPKKNYIYKSISSMQPQKLQQAIKKVHNFNFEFLPIDDNVISLQLNDIIRDLFVKNDSKVYAMLGEYLYKINFIFGKINDYVYRGNISQKVVELFVRNVWMSEIGEDTEGSNFQAIREWANREFKLYENGEDDTKEIEQQYRLDGKFDNVNKKITESFLIDVPRDDSGNIVREELANIIKKKSQYNYKKSDSGKRKTFFHFKSRINIRGFTKVFMESAQNSKKNSIDPQPKKQAPKPGTKLSTQELSKYRNEQTRRLGEKYKVDFEIKEESRGNSNVQSMVESKVQNESIKQSPRGGKSKNENSFDSHSDSDDFDPNAGMFSDNSQVDESIDNQMFFQEYDLMVVLDRSNDLVTPFVSQSSYLGLIDDLLKSESN